LTERTVRLLDGDVPLEEATGVLRVEAAVKLLLEQ
jgi:hypothetical protein